MKAGCCYPGKSLHQFSSALEVYVSNRHFQMNLTIDIGTLENIVLRFPTQLASQPSAEPSLYCVAALFILVLRHS